LAFHAKRRSRYDATQRFLKTSYRERWPAGFAVLVRGAVLGASGSTPGQADQVHDF